MQKGYNEIQSVEIELRILEQTSAPPSRPREYLNVFASVPPETEMATVRIKKVRFVDEAWGPPPSIAVGDRDHCWLSCKSLYFLFQIIKQIFSAPNPENSSRSLVMVNANPSARPGHLVYCFGDVDSRYCRGLSGSAGSDYIMKQIWLEFNG